MGDIADMMLQGLLDEETGEYIGDRNKRKYGMEAPGFPISYGRDEREAKEYKKLLKQENIARNARQKKTKCPKCGKKVKEIGLSDHLADVHGVAKK